MLIGAMLIFEDGKIENSKCEPVLIDANEISHRTGKG